MVRSKEIAGNLKASSEQLIDDMNGVLSKMQRRVLKELLEHLDELEKHIANLDEEINNFMNPDEKKCVEDIQAIPGIGATSAQAIISVIGTDMGRFATDRHISKWAGLCPGNNESAKKRKSGKTSKGNQVLRSTLIVCAHSAVKVKDSYFSAQFARISAHRGKKKAYVAVAHSMLIAIYHMGTSKNCFLRFWARDFASTKGLESPEYCMYCGLFNTHCWSKSSGQNPKGQFLEVPISSKSSNPTLILVPTTIISSM